jgi:hypothetical protein
VVFLFIAAAGVLAVAVAHLVIGWFVSNGLRKGALEVMERPADPGVFVRAVSPSSITLESVVPRQDIGHPGTLGLAWDGGYGQMGEVSDVRSMRSTRPFRIIEGDLPPVCTGELTGCRPVTIDSWAYPHDPADVGLGFEPVGYDTTLGPMSAWLVPAASSRRWAILIHGWTAEKREAIRTLPVFHENGYNSLVIDYRNDRGMPRDPSGHHRFGLTEWEEVEAAVEFVIQRGASEVVLTGFSTGAALAMSFLEQSSKTHPVRGVVFDAPNVILAEAIRLATTEAKTTSLMIEFGMWIADLRWRIDWNATNYVQRATTILQVPTLVFHGTADRTVPITVSRQLATRLPDLVELVETPAAGHVMSWNADPERYERYLGRFLSRL